MASEPLYVNMGEKQAADRSSEDLCLLSEQKKTLDQGQISP